MSLQCRQEYGDLPVAWSFEAGADPVSNFKKNIRIFSSCQRSPGVGGSLVGSRLVYVGSQNKEWHKCLPNGFPSLLLSPLAQL